MVIGFIRRVPVLGSLLNLPGIRSVSNHVFHNAFFKTTEMNTFRCLVLQEI
jgi:hypothetical protein